MPTSVVRFAYDSKNGSVKIARIADGNKNNCNELHADCQHCLGGYFTLMIYITV